jgi:tripartite-type tricarboxylate transporter receptor subunit TctC
MAMMAAADRIGRPFAAPPKTPPATMKILRKAFADVAKDPTLQADAKRVRMDVDYTPADETLKILNYVLTQPDSVVTEFGKYIKF